MLSRFDLMDALGVPHHFNGKNWPFLTIPCLKPWISFDLDPISPQLHSFLLLSVELVKQGRITPNNIITMSPLFTVVADSPTWFTGLQILAQERNNNTLSIALITYKLGKFILVKKFVVTEQLNIAFANPDAYASISYIEKSWSRLRSGLVTIDQILATNAPKQGTVIKLIDELYESGVNITFSKMKEVFDSVKNDIVKWD